MTARLRTLVHRLTRSLRAQLMLATAVPVVLLLTLLSLVGVYGFTRMTQTLVEERDAELVKLAAKAIADYWAASALLLAQIAGAPEVREGNVEATRALLSANTVLQLRFDEIGVTDVEGTFLATARGTEGGSVGQLSFYQRARRLRRPVRSTTYEDSQGRRIIAVAGPIYDVFGRFAGCVVGTWYLQGTRLGLPVDDVRVGDSGYAFLVNEFGQVLYHPDTTLIGGDASHHPAVISLLKGESGAQTVSVEGRTMVVGYAPIPLRSLPSSQTADESWGGWGLLTSERWDDIVAPLQPYARLMVLLLVLVVTLPLAILALSSRSIAAPLQSLVTQVERVTSGEFDTRVSLNTGPSEVRDLELAFNQMVEQLAKYKSDIQNYVVSILTSQEQERKRIARELHDDTAQALIVLGRRIEMAQELSDPDAIAQKPTLDALESLRDMVDDTLQGVRRFTRDLRPPLLEELGLPRTLEILGSRSEREEAFAVDVEIVGEPRQLLPQLELGLYRLAQEGLSNARRHARATQIAISLTYGHDEIMLQVTDDGEGFAAPTDPSDLMRSGRLGLMGIHERARLFGGNASIVSAPGGGTSITVRIPISPILLPRAPERDAQQASGDAVEPVPLQHLPTSTREGGAR